MSSFFRRKARKENTTGTSTVDLEIIEMVDIAINKIGPRYPGEISIFIADYYSKIDFEEFDDTCSDVFRAVITNSPVSSALSYDFALNFFGITEEQAALLRSKGHIENHCWSIVTNRRISQATISRVHSVIENHCDHVSIVGRSTDEMKISVRCKPV